jgi:iron complex outermembrane receptor protein
VVPGTPVASQPRQTSGTYGASHTFKSSVAMLRADFDLGFADLSSYTMYRDEHGFELKDYDSSPVPAFGANWNVFDKTASQELVLSSKKGGKLSWAGGAFFYRNKNEYPSFNTNSGGKASQHVFDSSITQSSKAVFADLTYEAVKDLFLTGGVRYSRDESDATFNVPTARLTRHGEHSWTNTSPRAVARYQLTPDSNVYASYSLGYKAGLIPITESVNPVEPEKVKAFEVGYKMARGSYRFDVSAFNYDYTNMQVASYIGTISLTRNAAASKIRGVDAQLSTDLWTPSLKLNVGATYMKANYDTFKGAVDYVQDLSLPAAATYGTFLNPAVDASGKMMLRTPRFTGNVGLAYHIPLETGKVVLTGNYYRTSKFYFDAPNRFSQEGYGLLNLAATYDANDHWSFSVFGKNVTNTVYRAEVLPGPVAIQQGYGEPRSWGASVSYHF